MIVHFNYHIPGKFGSRKVWQTWQIIHDSSNKTMHPNLTYRVAISLMAESIHLPNFFANQFKLANSSNINPAKLSRYTVTALYL